MKNKKIIITSISAIALILISITSYKLLGKSDNNSKDTSKIIISNYKGGKVTLREAQLELNKLIVRNEKLKGLTFNQLTSDQKENIIKEIIIKKIAYKEAKKRNLHKNKEYKEALRLFETEMLKNNLYADITKKASEEENLKKTYKKLVKEFKSMSYTQQMQAASHDLAKAIDNGQVSASRFNPTQLKQIRSGSRKIDEFTWHHHQDTGRMQLISSKIHNSTAHIGGEAIQQGR